MKQLPSKRVVSQNKKKKIKKYIYIYMYILKNEKETHTYTNKHMKKWFYKKKIKDHGG